jgi:hypothetical protein
MYLTIGNSSSNLGTPSAGTILHYVPVSKPLDHA